MCRKRSLLFLILLGLLLGMTTSVLAENKKPEVHTTKLTLHPTAAPVPSLKYRLLPRYREMKSGNAALLYLRAGIEYFSRTEEIRLQDEQQCQEWLEVPLSEIPLKQAKKLISNPAVPLFQDATLQDQCEWGFSDENKDLLNMALTHIKPIRSIFRLHHLQTRCYLAEGKIDKALENLQKEFAVAQHVADAPMMLCGMVGIAIARQACKSIEDAIQSPDCPNLYWALTQLPQPLVNLQKSFSLESDFHYQIMPEFANVEDDSLGADYWRRAMINAIQRWRNSGAVPIATDPSVPAMMVLMAYPKAKRSLIDDWSYDPKRIEAMPTAQVVALHTVRTYELIRDEYLKSFALSGSEWKDLTKGPSRSTMMSWLKKESIPFANLLLPAMEGAKAAEVKLTQSLDRLRLVEAIRLYAYHHEGQLPERLDQITEVPVPVDPVTGKPFSYRLEDDTAIIESSQGHYRPEIVRYEIQIAK